MVHQIVLARLDVLRGAEVHSVLLADMLDLLVRASQADNVGVKLAQVLAQHLGRVAGRIASNEDGAENISTAGSLADLVDDGGHLVKLIRADVGAVGEAEVDLSGCTEFVSMLQSPAMDSKIRWSSSRRQGSTSRNASRMLAERETKG